ncbi:MAG: hypothetical protein ACJATS_002384 [Psychroserpens sp.]|jgi:hypothetical protein
MDAPKFARSEVNHPMQELDIQKGLRRKLNRLPRYSFSGATSTGVSASGLSPNSSSIIP